MSEDIQMHFTILISAPLYKMYQHFLKTRTPKITKRCDEYQTELLNKSSFIQSLRIRKARYSREKIVNYFISTSLFLSSRITLSLTHSIN